MSDKKNIDRIFKEKFKDFEAAPAAGLWDAIENNLEQPAQKPKKALPLWYKIAGIAAGLALLLGVYYTFNSDQFTTTTSSQVVETNNTDLDKTHEVEENSTNAQSNKTDIQITEENTVNDIAISSQEDKNSSSEPVKTESALPKKSFKESGNDAYASSNTTSNNTPNLKKKTSNISSTLNSSDGQLPVEKLNSNKSDQSIAQNQSNNSYSKSNQPLETKIIVDPLNNSVENNTALTNSNKTAPVHTDTSKKDAIPSFKNPSKQETTATDIAQANVDSTKTIEPTLEALAQQQKQNEEDQLDLKDPFQKTWTATSMIAPVFSNTGSGSSIGDDFVDNGKVGGVNLSYGIAVGYDVSPRLSVRTGIHRVDLSYTTQDVVYKQPFDSSVQLLSTGNFNPTSVSDAGSTPAADIGSSFSQEFPLENTFSGFEGAISQQLGYLEVPLEVRYKVIDSKFSLNVIGGMSALFLTDNNIAITDNNTRLDLGVDNNFNDFNQSANFGVGMDYAFTNQLGFSIEPVFKYQLNPLRDNIAGFRPYNIGVYSGITYRF